MAKITGTLVKVIRQPKSASDSVALLGDQVIGFLVDEFGNSMESPMIGMPIYLSGDQTDLPWLFKTSEVQDIKVTGDHWIVTTDTASYTMETARQFQ